MDVGNQLIDNIKALLDTLKGTDQPMAEVYDSPTFKSVKYPYCFVSDSGIDSDFQDQQLNERIYAYKVWVFNEYDVDNARTSRRALRTAVDAILNKIDQQESPDSAREIAYGLANLYTVMAVMATIGETVYDEEEKMIGQVVTIRVKVTVDITSALIEGPSGIVDPGHAYVADAANYYTSSQVDTLFDSYYMSSIIDASLLTKSPLLASITKLDTRNFYEPYITLTGHGLSKVNFGNNFRLAYDGTISIYMRVYLASQSAGQHLWTQIQGISPFRGYSWFVFGHGTGADAGKIDFQYRSASGSTPYVKSATAVIPAFDQEYEIVLKYKNKVVSVIVDGVETVIGTVAPTSSYDETPDCFFGGKYLLDTGQYNFKGNLYDLRVWDGYEITTADATNINNVAVAPTNVYDFTWINTDNILYDLQQNIDGTLQVCTWSAYSSITKSMVGLSNVDNTADLNKPISTATQTALDAKANLADAIAFAIAL